MSCDLVLYGASNPCTLKILLATEREQPRWNFLGYLDDTLSSPAFGYPILGGRDRLRDLDHSKTVFLNNVFSKTAARKAVSDLLESHGCSLISLISPKVDLELVDVGKDVVIEHQVAIDAYVSIGDHCCIKRAVSIGHETKLEPYVFIGPGATVCGRVKIGEGAYLGAGCCIRDGVEIGAWSTVGVGAVVVKDVEEGTTVIGNPAKGLRRA